MKAVSKILTHERLKCLDANMLAMVDVYHDGVLFSYVSDTRSLMWSVMSLMAYYFGGVALKEGLTVMHQFSCALIQLCSSSGVHWCIVVILVLNWFRNGLRLVSDWCQAGLILVQAGVMLVPYWLRMVSEWSHAGLILVQTGFRLVSCWSHTGFGLV